MNFLLQMWGWRNGLIDVFFLTEEQALTAANALLASPCPMSVQIYKFVDGQGYTKEVFDQNNHVRVGLES